jgi:hypothetical protein
MNATAVVTTLRSPRFFASSTKAVGSSTTSSLANGSLLPANLLRSWYNMYVFGLWDYLRTAN